MFRYAEMVLAQPARRVTRVKVRFVCACARRAHNRDITARALVKRFMGWRRAIVCAGDSGGLDNHFGMLELLLVGRPFELLASKCALCARVRRAHNRDIGEPCLCAHEDGYIHPIHLLNCRLFFSWCDGAAAPQATV